MTADTVPRSRPDHTGSPLAGYLDRFTAVATDTGGAVRLAERPLLTQLSLRADPGTDLTDILGGPLPAPGLTVGDQMPRTLGLGPDEWLVLAPSDERQPMLDTLRPRIGTRGAVVDVSGQRTTITLTGPRSRELLAKGCALDLHPTAFHGARCAQTHLARAQVVLVAHPRSHDELWILARSSFARYVADWLLDATVEYHGTAATAR